MKRAFNKFSPFFGVTLILLVLAPNFVSAQILPDPIGTINTLKAIKEVPGAIASKITEWALGPIAKIVANIVYAYTYIAALIAGIAVAIEAWAIGVILNLNTQIIDSTPVQTGFYVALSIANLGFVAAIIVIAIATILRSQTYGIKQILWKLVIAALLVNFSLVIAGTILNFADTLTIYLLEQIDPSANGVASFTSFASKLAGAFNPQKGFSSINDVDAANIPADVEGAFGLIGQGFGKILTPIASLVFVGLSLIAIVITLLAMIVMLTVRYVFLGILLILMPFAWLLWVFPAFKSNWSKWWNNFLRWTFFAPLVIFFLYLGIVTSENMGLGAAGDYNLAQYASNSNPVWASIVNLVTNLFSPIVQMVLESIMIVGIMVGGLFAANALSITGASTFYGMAKGVGNAALGMTGRVAARVATRPLRGERGQKLVSALQAPGATRLGRALRTLTGARHVGRGLEAAGVAGGAKQVEDADRRIRGKTDDQLANSMTTFTAPERIAALKTLMSHGTLDKLKDKGGVDRYMNEDLFNRYSQGKLFGDLNKATLSNSAMREAAKIIGTEGEGATMVDKNAILGKANETVKAMDLMKKATMDFVQTLSKSDVSKAQSNDVFSEKDGLGIGEAAAEVLKKNIALGFAEARPELVPGMLPKLKGRQLQHFIGLYREALDEADITDEEWQKRNDAFEKSVLNNTMSFIPEMPTGEAPPGAPPPPPPKA